MKKLLLALATFAAMALPEGALAQQQPQPVFAAPRTVVDLGLLASGTEVMPLTGNGSVFTAYGTGTGTAPTTTALTLTASAAANPPCVGCFVSCPPGQTAVCTVTPGTTVAAFNGTTGITLSVAATITAAQVNFGTLCPISTQAAPVQPTLPMTFIQAGVNDVLQGIPLSIAGHPCVYGGVGPGLSFVNFPIGAH